MWEGPEGSGSEATGGCNLFMPGTLGGTKPVFTQYGEGTYAYNTDGNNLAPSIGAAWQIPGHTGAMGKILGTEEGDSVIRAGFGRGGRRGGRGGRRGGSRPSCPSRCRRR